MDDNIIELQRKANYHYRDRIIAKYRKRSGVDTYNFQVFDPWHSPYRYLLNLDGQTIHQVNDFASCLIVVNNEVIRICIPLSRYPKLAEAVLWVGQCMFSGNRVQRYLSVFKSYECICKSRNHEYSSIRNGLSHPESVLSHKRTIDDLNNIFGSRKIDLDNYKHLGAFFKYLGKLLIDNDKLLYEELVSKSHLLRLPKEYKRIMLNWEVEGF